MEYPENYRTLKEHGFPVTSPVEVSLGVLEGVGVIAFAISGVVAGATKRLDAFGVAVIAFSAAFGGGTLRDLLLDRTPYFWVANQGWVLAVLSLALTSSIFFRSQHIAPTKRAMQWPDAVGLGLFATSGTQIALEAGSSPLVATLMGVVSATFGGIIRDVLLNEIPWVVSSFQLYAVVAFTGGWLVWGLQALGMDSVWALALGSAITVILRILAILLNWELPRWSQRKGQTRKTRRQK